LVTGSSGTQEATPAPRSKGAVKAATTITLEPDRWLRESRELPISRDEVKVLGREPAPREVGVSVKGGSWKNKSRDGSE
jgi:hypothetical protein